MLIFALLFRSMLPKVAKTLNRASMSDQIKHECGIALIRLLKPLEYYSARYGTTLYGLNKLHLLMEKQHNRGQDGAGVAGVKFDMKPGMRYINRIRSNAATPIEDIFRQIYGPIQEAARQNPERLHDAQWLKENLEFTGELFLGHLRYGTFGKNNIENLHPVMRSNNWMTRNLVLAGNFNMTNVDELFNRLVEFGQYPVETSDTITILEKIGHFLDEANEEIYFSLKEKGYSKKESTRLIGEKLDLQNILSKSSTYWDGGYTIAGMIGHGDAFVIRDPAGIRPAFWYRDDEVVVVASERPVIQTVFNVPASSVQEVNPGYALIIRKSGDVSEVMCKRPAEKKSCSFERIYFSRGTDVDIYQERKKLGKLLVSDILKAIDYDIPNTVFSYIPNTAASAFYGLVEELDRYCDSVKKDKIMLLGSGISREQLDEIFRLQVRIEKVAVKDIKMRTFITQDSKRDDLVPHVYDITYGTVKPGTDNLVVIDDSVVRGTTLKRSIIRMLDRLQPRKIVIASSAPQIRYPDCYGIDMAKIGDFIAFNAAIELLKETGQENILNEVYRKCKEQEELPKERIENFVKEIYAPFSDSQISAKISALVTPQTCKASVEVVFQSIANLHLAIPGHAGDWYFTGDYPTPGGNKVVNQSFINYMEGKNVRAY